MSGLLVDAATSPINTVKTLMMLGYEPQEEYRAQSLFKGWGYRRVGAFTYARLVYRKFGLLGLTGSWPVSFLEAQAKQQVTQRVNAQLKGFAEKTFPSVDPNTFTGRVLYSGLEAVANCVGSIVVHPLKVLSVHMIATVVETDAPATFQPHTIVANIFNTTGIQGFYAGLSAQLMYDCVKVFAVRACESFLQFAGITDILQSSFKADAAPGSAEYEMQTAVSAVVPTLLAASLASYIYHPWDVVSRMMCISGSNLRLAQRPYQRGFKSALDCYRFLYRQDKSYFSTRGLFRGASMTARFYKTPLAILQ